MQRLNHRAVAGKKLRIRLKDHVEIGILGNSGGGLMSIEGDTLEESRQVLCEAIAQDIDDIPSAFPEFGDDRMSVVGKAREYARLLDNAFCGGLASEEFCKAYVVRLIQRNEEDAEAFVHWLRRASGQAISNPGSEIAP